ncbi:MAG TPA: DUF692 domain-containing protein [Labilithrix sp.]|nr:DUF692 domain-containing protein [Labilithrix sp.]
MRNGLHGTGIGYRRELAHALLAAPDAVDFVEIVAEACRDPASRREAVALAEVWPVVPHGVKLSLGSAEGLDLGRARELGRLARDVKAPLVSEHVSFVRSGGREIGHLTELPMTREVVKVVARNVEALRRALPDVPLLLENVARAFVWSDQDHEMEEGEFHAAVAEATGCDLLLDVGNLHANAVNAGLDPFAVLASYPLERVAMLHVAGGVLEHGFYFDTHAHPVPDAVFALVERVLAARDVPVLLERDAGYEAHAAILAETQRLRALSGRAPAARAPASARAAAASGFVADPALERAQSQLAEQLTRAEAGELSVAIVRARSVLERKRADDALPLLPELSARIAAPEALALGRIADVPRLATMTAVADAMRIAEAARGVPELARSAARDGALLRARFENGPAGPRPRTLPYVGRERLEGGDALWVVKGFGPGAPVRVIERGARR